MKLRGFRVDTAEVEAALVSHARVRRATVFVEDGGEHICAFYIADDDENEKQRPLEGAELREYARALLPRYALPTRLARISHFPLTANAKLDVAALRALGESMATEAAPTQRLSSENMPPNADEATLRRLWADELRVSSDRIGADDSFFELGGNSLGAQRLAHAIERSFGWRVTLADLLRAPTIREFAAVYRQSLSHKRQPLIKDDLSAPTDRATPAPLSFQQEAIVFEEATSPTAIYNLQFVQLFTQTINRTRLSRALRALAARHGILRTCLRRRHSEDDDDDTLCQIVTDELPEPLSSPIVATKAKLRALLADRARRRVDLSARPPLAAQLYEVADQTNAPLLFVVDMHHVLSDARTTQLLAEQLAELYGQNDSDRQLSLTPPLSYADWSREQRAPAMLERLKIDAARCAQRLRPSLARVARLTDHLEHCEL